jgi:hypothetical protein
MISVFKKKSFLIFNFSLGPPSANLTSRSAPTSRRGSAQSDRLAIGLEVDDGTGRGSLPGTPLAMPRSLPPSRRGKTR